MTWLFAIASVHPALGQHFSDCLSTTSNATILIPEGVSSSLGADGKPLASGDEIAVFTDDGDCAGAGQWNGSSLALAAAGINSQEATGYAPGESFKFKIWDASAQVTYHPEVTYASCSAVNPLCRDDGRYQSDMVYTISTLSANSKPVQRAADLSVVALADTLRGAPGGSLSLRVVLSNSGPDSVSVIEVTAALSPGLNPKAGPNNQSSPDSTFKTWRIEGLAANAEDTLTTTVHPEESSPFTLAVEVTSSSVPDPDSKPGNASTGEDDTAFIVIESTPATECPSVVMAPPEVHRSANGPDQIVVSFTHPEGLSAIHFTDENGRSALSNLTAAPSSEDFTSTDGIRWSQATRPDTSRTVTFTLTQADPRTATAQFQVTARSFCATVPSPATRFSSPAYTFDTLPPTLELLGNAPNPFQQRTTIHFKTPEATRVTLTVYNVLGQKIATLVDRELPAGSHEVTWSGHAQQGQALGSGVYLYRIRAGDRSRTGRMTIVR